MADLDLATILADGEYLRRVGDTLDGGPGGAGVDAEGAVDATAAAFAAGTHTNVTVTYNDTAGSISLASTAGGVTDPELLAIAGLTSAADRLPYFTGAGTAALTTFPAYGRSLTSAASAGVAQATLNLRPGYEVQAVDVTVQTVSSTAFTLSLGDKGQYLRFTGTNPTCTVPPNASVAFPVGATIDGIGTATAMTLIQGAGVTITKARTLVTVGAGSGWTLIKTATNAWDLHGDFV